MNQMLELGLMMIALFAVFYFFIMRPQQAQARRTREMHDGIKQNDVVLLHSGFEGKVRHIDEDMLTLEIGTENKVDVKVGKQFVLANVSEGERAAAEQKKADDEKAAKKDKKK